MKKLLLGAIVGFLLAALFAPTQYANGKTETCKTAGFLVGKKWSCTQEEKAELMRSKAKNKLF